MALNNQSPPRAPSAPSAPSVRSTVGTSNQNRGAAFKASTRSQNTGGVTVGPQKGPGGKKGGLNNNGGVGPDDKGGKGQFGGGKKTPWHKQQEREKAKNPATPPPPTPSPTTPQPTYNPKPDPRDSQYWANKQALESTFALEMERLNAQETQSSNDFALESAQMDEYNRRRQKAIAEARLGRGLRSGGAREERALNDIDYLLDSGRRQGAKSASDADRNLQRGSLKEQLRTNLEKEYLGANDRMISAMINESETGAGDSQNMEGIFRREDLQAGIKKTTKRIKALREKQKKAGPAQSKIIEARIKNLQQRRTKMKGKL
jgi:hypothetical protein